MFYRAKLEMYTFFIYRFCFISLFRVAHKKSIEIQYLLDKQHNENATNVARPFLLFQDMHLDFIPCNTLS